MKPEQLNNLSQINQPKDFSESLAKINDKEKQDDKKEETEKVKKGLSLSKLAKKIAKKKMESVKREKKEENEK